MYAFQYLAEKGMVLGPFIFYKEIKNPVDAFHYTVGILNIFTLK